MDLSELKQALITLASTVIRVGECIEQHKHDILAFLEAIQKLPEEERAAGDKWILYNWVPLLPGSTLVDYSTALDAPNTQEEADACMLKDMNNDLVAIHDYLYTRLSKNKSKAETLENAFSCYENCTYVGCILCVYSLIDYFFLINQKENESNWRKLPKNATDVVISEEEQKNNFYAYITVGIIKNIYQKTQDFTIEEKPLYRNYISHGMNDLVPNKTDCFKLFVLLYNVCMLFDYNVFHNTVN